MLYVFASFQDPLPWMTCDNFWNTNSCVPISQLKDDSHTYQYHQPLPLVSPHSLPPPYSTPSPSFNNNASSPRFDFNQTRTKNDTISLRDNNNSNHTRNNNYPPPPFTTTAPLLQYYNKHPNNNNPPSHNNKDYNPHQHPRRPPVTFQPVPPHLYSDHHYKNVSAVYRNHRGKIKRRACFCMIDPRKCDPKCITYCTNAQDHTKPCLCR